MAIHLLGTNHVSKKSAKQVEKLIASKHYTLIAVELDKLRAQKLLTNNTEQATFTQIVKEVGVAGAVFVKLGQWVQQKIGARMEIIPGQEMKTAMLTAGKNDIPVALIDRNIKTTLKRFTKAFGIRDFFRLIKSFFTFKKVKVNLSAVPDEKTIKLLIEEFDRILPSLSKTLLHERNAYMSKRLVALQKHYVGQDILAIVGAAHVPGMKECLNRLNKQESYAPAV